MKSVWKPALVSYVIAIIIHLITGWPVEYIIAGGTLIFLVYIFSYAGYFLLKRKFYK